MGMISMKKDMPEAAEPNQYGYGLCICLDEDQVKALGLAANPPRPGASVGVRAIATVRSVRQSADVGTDETGDMDTVLELQITDMEVIQQGDSADKAQAMYGGENG